MPAQVPVQVDSLERILNSAAHDTIKITASLSLSRLLRTSDATRTRALLVYADSLAQVNRRHIDGIRILSGMGILETMQGNYPEAIAYMERALQKARVEKHRVGEAENLTNLGIINRRIGNYAASQEYYLQSIKIYDALNDLEGMGSTYENLGVVTDLMKDYDGAMAYYEKSLAIEQSMGRKKNLTSLYNNMAIVEHNRGNNALAIQMLKEALEINKQYENSAGVIANYMNLANFLNDDLQHTTALLYLDSVNIILLNSHDVSARANLAYNYAESNLLLNNPVQALNFALESLQLSETLQSYKMLADAHGLLTRIYEQRQDYPLSLIHHKAYTSFRDSLFNETKNKEIANYQVQLEVFSKNKLISDQEIEMLRVNQLREKERRLLILFAIITALALLVVYLFVQKFIQSKRTRKKLEEQNALIQKQKTEIESVNQQLEMRLLRTQLNPHFIFNALSSIQHLITGNDKASSLNYLGKFSRLLRQVLDNSAETTVVLAEEIKLLKAYIELEALRFNHDFQYEIRVAENIDQENTELPVLLVQPLIENAILHGLLPSKKKKSLQVYFYAKQDQLICEVSDNGVGRKVKKDPSPLPPGLHTSHGLNITRQRIGNRLSEDTEAIHYQDITDEMGQPAGTRVVVQIPSNF